jgi:cytochrome c
MSSFEWNKIIASVLTALIVAWVCGILASQLFEPKPLGKPVFMPAGAEQQAAATPTEQAAAAGPEPIAPLLAKADPKKGEQIAKVCTQCHTFEKGQPNKIGPNLWDVVGQPMGEDRGGYQFSSAMEGHKGDKWDPEDLNKWLFKPQAFIKGTKMTFVGLPKAEDRADVISYLDTLK